jgi:hypothetical protein
MYREILLEELRVDKTLGYVYFLDTKHPLASKGVGRVYYHRHVASINRGQWLTDAEIVHHKDNNKQNNASINLEVMTSVDHALLHAIERGQSLKTELTCPICGTNFMVHTSTLSFRVHCSEKCAKQASINWQVSKEELEVLIWNMPYTKIASVYPISDVGAKKRAKSLGCTMPPPYFHSKSELFRKQQRNLHNISDLPTQ